MKKINLLILLSLFVTIVQAQQTCATAVSITPSNACNFTTHITTGTEYWMKFTASSPTVNVALVTTKFGINATHIHNVALYTGNCSAPILVADDELPFEVNADELSIDLNASGLIIGQSYYLKASRLAKHSDCDKAGCTANGSTAPTAFNICVEDIEVIIPKDFGLELPSSSYSYQTNRGQIIDLLGNKRPEIKLFTNTNPALFIADDKISYVFNQDDNIIGTPDAMHRVDMTLVGSNTGRKVFKTEKLEGVTNYYLDHTPLGLTGNKDYYRTATSEVYPLIDMQWYSNSLGEKFYFIIKPNGDPDDIIMQFDGATNINVLANGGLKVTTPLGDINYEPPHAYRVNPAGNVVPMPWQAKFEAVPNTTNQLRFKIHNYSHNMPLFIQVDKGHEPPVSAQAIDNLTWSTYFNGSGDDIAYDITTDAAENSYVVGTSSSAALSFPQSTGAHQPLLSGLRDAFISQFDIGAVREYSTFYGGTSTEEGYGVAIGSNNNLYFCGTSSSSSLPSLPSNNGIYIQGNGHTNFNGYIAELDASNGIMQWQSYFGGAAHTKCYKLAIDNADNVFVTGRVRYTTNIATATGGTAPAGGASGGFPILTPVTAYVDNAFDFLSVGSGGLGTSDHDAFIAKFNTNNQLEWSTLWGGQKFDDAVEIAIDPTNQNVIITGNTQTDLISDDICGTPNNGGFPLCLASGNDYYLDTWHPMGGFGMSYISRFDNVGQLLWSTYFDGLAGGLVFNNVGEFYVSGITQTATASLSTSAPTTPAHSVWAPGSAFGQYYAADWDCYINKFNSLNEMTWGTYYGGTTEESTLNPFDELGYTDLAVDNKNIVYMTGASELTPPNSFNDFPTLQYTGYYFEPFQQPIVDNVPHAFVIAFDKSNQRQWATMYGAPSGTGTNNDGKDNGLAIATAGNSLFVTGFTHSVDFPFTCPPPTTGTPFCQNYVAPASFDVFLGRFDISALVGVNEDVAINHNLNIYPNPTSNELNIEFYVEDKSNINISIHNIVGQKIYNEQVQNCFGSCKKRINTESYANGIYVISINFGEGTVVKKIVKQ